ncbi:MAG: PD-(D/E)XK nuclease family protein [Phycisphaerae bacterium]|nr:PD-(D/E)XK nuclease family protein [Phycisphaerae bacterium]
MEQTGNHDWGKKILAEVSADGHGVVLLSGPADCGKTAAALELYRSVADTAVGSACLLVPNAATGRYLVNRLRAETPSGVLVSPRVTTFAGLGRDILAACRDSAHSITPFDRHLLLREIIGQLHQAGKFHALGAVASAPGLTATLDKAIAELKRAAVDPQDLAAAVGSNRGKSHDLLLVYQAYQQRLQQDGLFDVEGQLWQVREHLADAGNATNAALGLGKLKAIIVDGFTDFTPTQLEILRLLSSRVERLLITLPLANDERQRMWQWTSRTRDALRRAFGDAMGEINLPPKTAPADSPATLAEKVFALDIDDACPPPKDVHVIAAAGIDSEVAAIARRIKKLLVDGAPAGSIAVLARSADAYRDSVTRIFGQFDIPAQPAAITLPAVPVVRFALAVLEMAGGGFEFLKVLRVIRNSYFRPAAMGNFNATTVAAAEWIIRQGNVLGGREAYAAAAERLGRRASERLDEDEKSAAGPNADAIAAASQMLASLFDIAADAAKSPGLTGLANLTEKLQLAVAACAGSDPARAARDLRAIQALASLARRLDDSVSQAQAVEAMAHISLPAARTESLVDFMSVLDARAMRWRHVFIVGCSEGQFPRRVNEASLLGETDRQNWQSHGVKLDLRADLTAREMLLFYLAASRAEVSLTISYLHADAGGKASAPGSFLEALLTPAGGLDAWRDGGQFTLISHGQFTPPADEIASPAEALRAGVAGLFSRDYPPCPAGLKWSAQQQGPLLRQVATGLWAGHRRWQFGPCNEYDGNLTDAALKEQLARRYPEKILFSASRLSTFGQCPWRYFAKYVLGLEPLIEPERQLQAVSKGIFCHDVLYATLTDLAATLGRPLKLTDIAAADLAAALNRNFDAQAARVEARTPHYPLLWEIQKKSMRAELAEYLKDQCVDNPLPAECLNFELAFGMAGTSAEMSDPASQPVPVEIQTPAGVIRLRGRIDRVDRVEFEGLAGLLVVDYKTGSLPKSDASKTGQNTQVPLYTIAAEQLLGEQALGGAFHGIAGGKAKFSYFAAIKLSRGKLSVQEDYQQMRDAAIETIGRFVTSMGQGQFALQPVEHACKYCPYRQACHVSPARAEVKMQQAGRASNE